MLRKINNRDDALAYSMHRHVNNQSPERLIIFTRYPLPGQVKTRLISFLGPGGAAQLHKQMTEFAVAQARLTQVPVQVCFTGGTMAQMREWLGDDLHYCEQQVGNLGERMERAFAEAFRGGARRIVMVGCDCPDNRARNILTAFGLLKKTPCVIGPARDGGYYMIGLARPQPHLFADIDWGSKRVLEQTTTKAESYTFVQTLQDVDEPGDVPARITVIIPALNEAQNILPCLRAVNNGFNVEALVVDGGSGDDTRRLAVHAGAMVLESHASRARQMNLGAAKASGELLLFLHADSELPLEWDRHVRRMMCRRDVALGHFRFAVRERVPGIGLIEWGTNLRSRFWKRPYGDQGLFMTRERFNLLGGYPDVPILEDLYLVLKAQKYGRIRQLDLPLPTSGRRWAKHGIVKTTLMNQCILVAAALGADLHKLRKVYREGLWTFFRRW